MPLFVEISLNGREWTEIGRLLPGHCPGTLSDRSRGGRDIIKFACHGVNAVIERSLGGIDIESDLTRRVGSIGWTTIATLVNGGSVQMSIQTDRMPEPAKLRFRYES